MAYREDIAEKVRHHLAAVSNVAEKKMFGGLAFMVNEKLCVCVGGEDGDIVMVRVGKDAYQTALKQRGAGPTMMNGREMKGYVEVDADGQKDLDSWIQLALAFNKELTR